MSNIIFIHGLESSGHGFKGNFFREKAPGCLTPDFKAFNPNISYQKLLQERMQQLIEILKDHKLWKIIGSSFGGLMGALFTLNAPKKVERLILLAPLLAVSELNPKKYSVIDKPIVIFHGKNDKIISIKKTKKRAQSLFSNLSYKIVDDDHMLHSTVKKIDWKKLLEL